MQVVTVKDYDVYCHYVAGLVGIGLSHLFGESNELVAVLLCCCAPTDKCLSLYVSTLS